MKALNVLLVLLLLFLASGCASVAVGPAVAHSYSGPKGVATMYDAPCVEPKVLRHIPAQYRSQFKAGEGTYEGPKYALCWAEQGDTLLIVWEDGGFGRLSKDVLAGGTGV